MKNRLKGVTLIETMLYIGLFSVILIMVLNFMLSTQEATQRTNRRSDLNQASEFITQHINYSFSKAISINEANCTFGNNQGIMELQFPDGNRQYSVLNNTLYFDGVPISMSEISVDTFSLEAVYDRDSVIIGIRTSILLSSLADPNLTDTINILSILR